MALQEELKAKIIDWIQPIANDLNLELVDIELAGSEDQRILRVVIDKDGGVLLDDCSNISRKVSLILDVEEPFPFRYNLEVSSPGIFRELKKTSELIRFKGKRIKASLSGSVNKKYKFIGTLIEADEETVVIESESQNIKLERSNIKKVQLYPEI